MLIVYLILLAISMLFYILYIGSFSFYLLVFLLSLPVVLFALNFYISRKLKIYFLQPLHKAVGKSVTPLQIVVENPTIFPVANVEIVIEHRSPMQSGKQKNTAKINLPVLSKETQTMRLSIASLHLGAIEMKIKKCRIYDFLRLFKFKVRGKAYKQALKETTILVYPQYSHLDNSINDYSGFGIESDEYSPDKKGDDPSQVFDIHEYIEGDKPNRIHWKLTAKQDSVMVKDYSLMMTYSVHLFANLNSDNVKDYDIVIESALSVSMLLIERNIAHTLEWYDAATKSVKSFSIKTESEHYECADALIRTKTYSDPAVPIYPFTEDAEQICCGNLIILSSRLPNELMTAITESGYSARYLFAFTQTDPNAQQTSAVTISDNAGMIEIRKDHIGDSFLGIDF